MSSVDQEPEGRHYAIGQDEETLKNFSMRTVDNSAPHVKPYLRADSHVLDLGCGPGSITADFAKRCPRGRVVGLDSDGGVIARATKQFCATDETDSLPLEFITGDAVNNLPFDDDTFDLLHGHQFAQFVPDVSAGVAEWRRVLRPGGVLAFRVVWLPGMVTSPPDTAAFGHLADAMNGMFRASGGDPCVLQGELPAAARAAGFSEVDVSMDAVAITTKDMRRIWRQFMLADNIVGAWRKMGVVDDEQIEAIRAAIMAVEEAEHGFAIIPSVDAICRV